jgi:hypothetical protein
MRYKNEPAHAPNYKGNSGENNYLLQYVHDVLLISLIYLATAKRRNLNCRTNCPQ